MINEETLSWVLVDVSFCYTYGKMADRSDLFKQHFD